MPNQFATIPMKMVGPIKLVGENINEEVIVPLATFEAPLWPAVGRGARVSRLSDGIHVTLIDERMTRSVAFEASDAGTASRIAHEIYSRKIDLAEQVAQTSRFAQLINLNYQIIGNLLYLRFELSTGDAAGHNMVTKAADHLMHWLLNEYPELSYVSVSGNFCTDKKVSAVNGLLGRGKNVVAEITISRELCEKQLRITPEVLVDLHIKKNLLGSIAAGSLRSANAHVANMLLAFYLATGQDAANIVEGSQGIVHAAVKKEALYFSVTLPNIIVGSVGNGKDLNFVQENLKQLGCFEKRELGENARRLAMITASVVLCGELSLLAALANPGELMRAHVALERKQ